MPLPEVITLLLYMKTPEQMAVTIASMQGASALYTDQCVLENPYPIQTPMYDAWEQGWIKAYQQAVREFAFGYCSNHWAKVLH